MPYQQGLQQVGRALGPIGFGEAFLAPTLPQGQNPAAKAYALLRERLGPARWQLFQETGVLMVPSRRWPGLDYRLRYSHPVEAIERGSLRASLCVVAKRGEPEADRLLTILDLIETDERKLWEMAKVSYGGRLEPPPPLPLLTPDHPRRMRWRKMFDPSEMEAWWFLTSVWCVVVLFVLVVVIGVVPWLRG